MEPEFRAFLPCSLAELPAAALALLYQHLDIKPSAPAKARTDAYALCGSPRLGLKQRSVGAGDGAQHPWELKVSLAAHEDCSETLEKFELEPGSAFSEEFLPLTKEERATLAAAAAQPASTRALVAKRRQQGKRSCSELVDLQLTLGGARHALPYVSFCLEEAEAQRRGGALLQALQALQPEARWHVVSYAGWLEAAAAAARAPPPPGAAEQH